MFRIRTYNTIAEAGLQRLSEKLFEVGPDVERPDALLLRSHKLDVDSIPDSVLAVARAGAGYNNIPVEALTERGVVVFNTPGANANAVAELVQGALLIQVRNLLAGMRYSTDELQDVDDSQELNRRMEAEKKRFRGEELNGRTLCVIGLGSIGSRVAHAGVHFGMNVIGYDPWISVEAAWMLSSQVEQSESLRSLAERADFVSVHVPAVAATQHLINAEFLAWMRPHARLLNFSRAEVVDADAVVAALESDSLGGYSCDFPTPALIRRARECGDVHLFPHLGASTREAEINCSEMAARQLSQFLRFGHVVNSVNFPRALTRTQGASRLVIFNRNISGMLGRITDVLTRRGVNVVNMNNKSRSDVAITLIDSQTPMDEELMNEVRSIDGVLGGRLIQTDSLESS
ncbi:MAG: 3-phosphoglycerate dehydrogenase [Gammaproteobacteria bacterium AqS3]|nr:3-phosphoglycerate dehydrogenase [Gammaproteobacteria bacterium AqS3]